MKNARQNKTIRTVIKLFAIFFATGLSFSAQTPAPTPQIIEARELLPTQIIERKMSGAETHRYKFELKKNEFFQVRVEQKGIDVALKLLDADSQNLATMDSPNEKEGPETLTFVAEKAGIFILEISGFEPKAEKGIYTIKREASREAVPNDKRRIEIEKLFVEGLAARDTDGEEKTAVKKLEESLLGWQQLGDDYLTGLTVKQINQLKDIIAQALVLAALKLYRQATAESYKTALPMFQESNRLYTAIDDKKNAGISLVAVGLIHDNLGNQILALEFYEKALQLFQTVKDKSWEAIALSKLGGVYDNLGEKQKALKYYNLSRTLFQELGDKEPEAEIVYKIGGIYSDLGENEKAFEYYDQSLRLSRAVGNRKVQALILNNIGLIYNSLGDNQKAFEYFNESISIALSINDKSAEAVTLNNIGKIYDSLGEKSKALEHFNRSLQYRRALEDKLGEAVTLNNIGNSYFDLGESQKALDYFNQALPIFRLVGDKAGEAVTLNNIGRVSSETNKREKAIESYGQSLNLFKEINNRVGEANVLYDLGEVYEDLMKYEQSQTFYEAALKLYRNLGNRLIEAAILNKLGLLNELSGKNEKALELYQEALTLYQILNDSNRQAIVLVNIGRLYKKILGNEEKALDSFNKAQLIAPSQNVISTVNNEKDVETISLKNSGESQSGKKYAEEDIENQAVEKYYEEAVILARNKGFIPGEANAFADLMFYWEAQGNYRLAIYYGKQAVNTFQKVKNKNVANQSLQTAFLRNSQETYRNLAELLIAHGSFAQAEKVLAMLKEEEYFDFVRRDESEIEKLAERVPLSDKEKALIARYSQLADKITEIGQEFIKLEDKKRTLSRNDLALSADEQTRYAELEKQLMDANAAFQLFLTKELVAEIGKEKAEAIEIDRNLQEKLRKWGDGTVALYTVAGEDRYRVILTTPKVQVDGKTEIKIADLNKKVFAFRAALQNPNIDPRPLGKELYDILIKPVEKELKAANAKTLVWSLDGTLRYIPLAALSPDGKRYLVEDVQNVIITPKTRDDFSNSDANWHALGLGVSEPQTVSNPEDKTRKISFNSLPGTERELFAIVKDEKSANEVGVLPGRRFMNKDFTTVNLKDSLVKENADGKNKYNIVHIASHFRLGSNWSNSFLLLGNGEILTLEEIDNSPAISFGDVELVTLSACNTGFADDTNGKEIDSLASVIQAKSGKAVLATLWAVVDKSTAQLMSEFYRLRRENPKLTKAEAIQLAQQNLIRGDHKSLQEAVANRSDVIELNGETVNQPAYKENVKTPFAHPFYWSPFVLYGNWR